MTRRPAPPDAAPAADESATTIPIDRGQLERVQTALLAWFAANGRDLPWRQTRDPYRILVSEVMLQQIQVSRS